MTLTSAGSFFGTAVAFPIAGLLMNIHKEEQDAWSKQRGLCPHGISTTWPWVFYLLGGVGVVWWLFWHALVTDRPEDNPSISAQELRYIQETAKEDADTTLEKVSITK